MPRPRRSAPPGRPGGPLVLEKEPKSAGRHRPGKRETSPGVGENAKAVLGIGAVGKGGEKPLEPLELERECAGVAHQIKPGFRNLRIVSNSS